MLASPSRIGLGTVQFGLDYGVSNGSGQTSEGEVSRILKVAAKAGLRVLDTAVLYGNSEEVLGRQLPANSTFKIVTKTSQFECEKLEWSHVVRLEKAFTRSLEHLGLSRVYGLLIHRADDLLKPGGDRIYDWLLGLKSSKRVSKIGVSVYTPEQLESVFEIFPLDMVQLPMNVLDRRFERCGQLDALWRQRVEIHIRSVFLQGVLLMAPSKLPPWFDPVREHLCRYHATLAELGLSALQGALGAVLARPEPEVVLCGVNTGSQLEDILAALSGINVSTMQAMGQFAVDEPLILNPALWRIEK